MISTVMNSKSIDSNPITGEMLPHVYSPAHTQGEGSRRDVQQRDCNFRGHLRILPTTITGDRRTSAGNSVSLWIIHDVNN